MHTLLWLCATVACIIFGVMLHSVATFRSASDRRRHAAIEVGWALIPILIVIAAAWPSMRSASTSAIVIAASE